MHGHTFFRAEHADRFPQSDRAPHLSLCKDTFVKDDDLVDRVIEQWRVERPDLDPSGKAVTARIVRAAGLTRRRIDDAIHDLGVREGEFGTLAALRRAGAPYELSPSQLTQHLVLSSGGLSLMLDRFERAGLVRRRRNPDDRRGVLVALTDAGLEVIDEAMTRLADVEQQLVGGLTTRERDQLARLLAKYLRTNDEV
jgi:DNA-binding MarR family transcriptional regulator